MHGESMVDPKSYIFGAVRNAAVDEIRRYWPGALPIRLQSDALEGEAESLFEQTPAPAGPSAAAEEQELCELIARTLDTLPSEQKEAVVMKVYGGLTFAQIAEITREPLPTVSARYRRALERLRPQLELLK